MWFAGETEAGQTPNPLLARDGHTPQHREDMKRFAPHRAGLRSPPASLAAMQRQLDAMQRTVEQMAGGGAAPPPPSTPPRQGSSSPRLGSSSPAVLLETTAQQRERYADMFDSVAAADGGSADGALLSAKAVWDFLAQSGLAQQTLQRISVRTIASPETGVTRDEFAAAVHLAHTAAFIEATDEPPATPTLAAVGSPLRTSSPALSSPGRLRPQKSRTDSGQFRSPMRKAVSPAGSPRRSPRRSGSPYARPQPRVMNDMTTGDGRAWYPTMTGLWPAGSAASTENIQRWLVSVPLFKSLAADREFIADVAEVLEVRQVSAGHVIIEKGTEGDEMFIVGDGSAEVYLELDGAPLANIGRGKFFGEAALLERERRTAYVKAATQMKLYVLTRGMLRAIFGKFPTLKEIFERPLEERRLAREQANTAQPKPEPEPEPEQQLLSEDIAATRIQAAHRGRAARTATALEQKRKIGTKKARSGSNLYEQKVPPKSKTESPQKMAKGKREERSPRKSKADSPLKRDMSKRRGSLSRWKEQPQPSSSAVMQQLSATWSGTVTGEPVGELLISLKLGHFTEIVEAAGYCFVRDLSGADDAELSGLAKECDMRKPELRRLKQALVVVRENEPAADNEEGAVVSEADADAVKAAVRKHAAGQKAVGTPVKGPLHNTISQQSVATAVGSPAAAMISEQQAKKKKGSGRKQQGQARSGSNLYHQPTRKSSSRPTSRSTKQSRKKTAGASSAPPPSPVVRTSAVDPEEAEYEAMLERSRLADAAAPPPSVSDMSAVSSPGHRTLRTTSSSARSVDGEESSSSRSPKSSNREEQLVTWAVPEAEGDKVFDRMDTARVGLVTLVDLKRGLAALAAEAPLEGAESTFEVLYRAFTDALGPSGTELETFPRPNFRKGWRNVIRATVIWGTVFEAGVDDEMLSSVTGFMSACSLLKETITDAELRSRLEQTTPDVRNGVYGSNGRQIQTAETVLEFVLWVAQRRARREGLVDAKALKVKRSTSANSTGALRVDGLRLSLLRELFGWCGCSKQLEGLLQDGQHAERQQKGIVVTGMRHALRFAGLAVELPHFQNLIILLEDGIEGPDDQGMAPKERVRRWLQEALEAQRKQLVAVTRSVSLEQWKQSFLRAATDRRGMAGSVNKTQFISAVKFSATTQARAKFTTDPLPPEPLSAQRLMATSFASSGGSGSSQRKAPVIVTVHSSVVGQLFGYMDRAGLGKVEIVECVRFFAGRGSAKPPTETSAEVFDRIWLLLSEQNYMLDVRSVIRNLFSGVDPSDSGYITPSQLQGVLKKRSIPLSGRELKTLDAVLDEAGEGRVGTAAFGRNLRDAKRRLDRARAPAAGAKRKTAEELAALVSRQNGAVREEAERARVRAPFAAWEEAAAQSPRPPPLRSTSSAGGRTDTDDEASPFKGAMSPTERVQRSKSPPRKSVVERLDDSDMTILAEEDGDHLEVALDDGPSPRAPKSTSAMLQSTVEDFASIELLAAAQTVDRRVGLDWADPDEAEYQAMLDRSRAADAFRKPVAVSKSAKKRTESAGSMQHESLSSERRAMLAKRKKLLAKRQQQQANARQTDL